MNVLMFSTLLEIQYMIWINVVFVLILVDIGWTKSGTRLRSPSWVYRRWQEWIQIAKCLTYYTDLTCCFYVKNWFSRREVRQLGKYLQTWHQVWPSEPRGSWQEENFGLIMQCNCFRQFLIITDKQIYKPLNPSRSWLQFHMQTKSLS